MSGFEKPNNRPSMSIRDLGVLILSYYDIKYIVFIYYFLACIHSIKTLYALLFFCKKLINNLINIGAKNYLLRLLVCRADGDVLHKGLIRQYHRNPCNCSTMCLTSLGILFGYAFHLVHRSR